MRLHNSVIYYRLLWASAPPKLALHPLTIKQQLCPQYIEEAPVTEDSKIDVQDRNENHIYNLSLRYYTVV